MAGRFPLAVGSKANKSEPWKAGRTVGTTCACASAYGRRYAPSLVGLCLLCLDLSVSCVRDACRLHARVFHARRKCRHFVLDTQINHGYQAYDINCVAALLIHPRKVTQVHINRFTYYIRWRDHNANVISIDTCRQFTHISSLSFGSFSCNLPKESTESDE